MAACYSSRDEDCAALLAADRVDDFIHRHKHRHRHRHKHRHRHRHRHTQRHTLYQQG